MYLSTVLRVQREGEPASSHCSVLNSSYDEIHGLVGASAKGEQIIKVAKVYCVSHKHTAKELVLTCQVAGGGGGGGGGAAFS